MVGEPTFQVRCFKLLQITKEVSGTVCVEGCYKRLPPPAAPSPGFPPAHPLEPSPGAQRPGGLRDPGDQPQAELFASSTSREDKCVSQRCRHTHGTPTRLAALTTADEALT